MAFVATNAASSAPEVITRVTCKVDVSPATTASFPSTLVNDSAVCAKTVTEKS